MSNKRRKKKPKRRPTTEFNPFAKKEGRQNPFDDISYFHVGGMSMTMALCERIWIMVWRDGVHGKPAYYSRGCASATVYIGAATWYESEETCHLARAKLEAKVSAGFFVINLFEHLEMLRASFDPGSSHLTMKKKQDEFAGEEEEEPGIEKAGPGDVEEIIRELEAMPDDLDDDGTPKIITP